MFEFQPVPHILLSTDGAVKKSKISWLHLSPHSGHAFTWLMNHIGLRRWNMGGVIHFTSGLFVRRSKQTWKGEQCNLRYKSNALSSYLNMLQFIYLSVSEISDESYPVIHSIAAAVSARL